MKSYGMLLVAVCLVGWPMSGSAAEPMALSQVSSWAYQIQGLDEAGAIAAIVNSDYDMIVVDPTVTSDSDFDAASMVSRIKGSMASDGVHRKLVLAYIDIGEMEEWRWYWNGQTTYEEYGTCQSSYIGGIKTWASWVVACDPDGWAGNYPVAYWKPGWKQVVIYGTALGSGQGLSFNSMLTEVLQDGFDGVYLDWVEGWEMDEVQTLATSEGRNSAWEMFVFMWEIKTFGKRFNSSFLVIQQNSSELINQIGATTLASVIDGIAQEGIWWDGEASDTWDDPNSYDQATGLSSYYLPRLQQYRSAGLPVFTCDYALEQSASAYASSQAQGFIPYVTRTSLSQLTTTPPE